MTTKLTVEKLRKLREGKREELRKRSAEGKETCVLVGMGTCGLAAGAKQALDAIADEVRKSGVANVTLKPTGCMGLCYSEPTVEVQVPGMPAVIYGKVDGDVGRKIVREHLIGKQLVNGHIYDRPGVEAAGVGK